MAVTVTSVGSAHDFAVTSLPTGATITVVSGDWLVAVLATASDLTVTFSDTGGNTWTNRVSVMDAAARAKIHIATAPITSGFSSGTVTASLSSASGQDALQVYRVRPSSGTVSFVAADTAGVDGNLTTHAAATVSVALGNIIFGAASIETNDPVTGDTDTLNGSWSSIVSILEDGGTDLASIVSSSQYKIVTGTGNQSWACSTTSARNGICSYLVLQGGAAAAFKVTANQGSYALNGVVATLRKSKAPLVAGVGSYALTGTAAVPEHGWLVSAAAGSYALTGTAASPLHGWKVTADAGSYALTGTTVTLTSSNSLVTMADAGTYVLTGTDATPLHGGASIAADSGSYALTGTSAPVLHAWRVTAGTESAAPSGDVLLETGDFLLLETGDRLVLDDAGSLITAGSYALTGTDADLILRDAVILAGSGSYALAGTDATLTAVVFKSLTADPGSYALTGDNVDLLYTMVAAPGTYALTGAPASLVYSAAAVPATVRAMGEPPIARDQRRRREAERARALEQQRKARDRLKAAIGRLLEGLPPEFDEPEQLAQAEDNAIQAFNLLRAMQAPWQELNALNELIDHIRQLRIAQPIAQLALAQAYNQAHRHLQQKAAEDVVMTLLLGE